MRTINTATQLCAVIGNPVGHSLSPAMHNAAFDALGLNYVYLAFNVAKLPDFFAGMRAMPNFCGVSVTIPHKIEALPLMDEVSPMAQKVACVNTVTQNEGKLIGTITDGLGTLRAFEEAGVNLVGKRVLFLGAGGAVRAVAFAMAEAGAVGHITILGRSPEKVHGLSEDLAQGTRCGVSAGDLEKDCPTAMGSHDIIVQGTPMGMHPNGVGQSPVKAEEFEARHVAFDMVYRPMKTRFLEDAKNAGALCIPGMDMLLNQAQLQFETWTGLDAPRDVMRQTLVSQLQ